LKEWRSGADKDQAAWKTWFEGLPLFAQAFEKYPGYDGSLVSKGHVGVIEDTATSQRYVWDLEGLDPDCVSGPNAENNSCGVHVHKGEFCEDASGHWYNSSIISDPWTTVTYNSTKTGDKEVSKLNYDSGEMVDTKLTMQEVSGKTFVIHQHATGAKVACSPLDRPYEYVAKDFKKRSDYPGDLVVKGNVKISGSATGLQFIYRLEGLEETCTDSSNDPAVPNRCGLAIHVGPNCSDAGVRFFKAGDDPWPHTYTTGVDGKDDFKGYAIKTDGTDITTNLPASDLFTDEKVTAVIAIHSHDGGLIFCSTIEKVKYDFGLTAAPAAPPDSFSFNVRLGLGSIVASLLMFIA